MIIDATMPILPPDREPAKCRDCGVDMEEYGDQNGIVGWHTALIAINSDTSFLCGPCRVSELRMQSLKHFRTRWRRWLGNKTAIGRPYWTTLLDSRWTGWCDLVRRNHDEIGYKMAWTRESVKAMYLACINVATMRELMKLDDIYASEKLGI